MGYTHFFHEAQATPEIIDDARKIVATTSVMTCGPSGHGEPEFSAGQGILLNGAALFGEDGETFHLLGTEPYEFDFLARFCKTDRQPYDEVVTAILVSVFVRTGVPVSGGTYAEWAPGIELFERAVRDLTDDEKLALDMHLAGMKMGAGA